MKIFRSHKELSRKDTANYLKILALSLFASLCIYQYASNALTHYVEESLTEMAVQGSEIVAKELEMRLNLLETLSKMDSIREVHLPIETKLELLETFITDEFLRISIANSEGYSQTTDEGQLYIYDRTYFKRAMEGKANISEPTVSRVDGTKVVAFAVPIYNKDQVYQVLYATYPIEALSEIAESVQLGESSNAMIVDSTGRIIAHNIRALVDEETYLVEDLAQGNDKVRSALKEEILNNQSGASAFREKGEKKYIGYAPVRETNWIFAISSPKQFVFGDIQQVLLLILLVTLVVIIIILILYYYIRFFKTRLGEEELFSKNVIDSAQIIVIGFDEQWTIRHFNPYAEHKTGYTADEVVGKKRMNELLEEEDFVKLRRFISSYKAEDISNYEFSLSSKCNEKIHVMWNLHTDRNLEKRSRLELIGVDITDMIQTRNELQGQHEELTALYEELSASEEELKSQFDQLIHNQDEIRKSEERYQLVLEISQIGIWDWDISHQENFYSDKWFELFGYHEKQRLSLEDWIERIHPQDAQVLKEQIEDHLDGKSETFECEFRLPNHENRWLLLVGKAIYDNSHKPYRLAGAFIDITDKRAYEEKIKKYAYYDLLTGLPNRMHLLREFERLKLTTSDMAIVFMDLDNFKLVNDTYGHNFGDQLLKEVAKRLEYLVEYNYIVSRLGGDEFVILLRQVSSREEIEHFCQLLIETLNESYEIAETLLNISVSMGVASYPEDGQDIQRLLQHADAAMYKAKEYGKNRFVLFENHMNVEAVEKMTINTHMRTALERQEFVIYYQPQYDLEVNKISGFEALLRWDSPELGLVSPGKFINIAEENHMIIPLGEWVLENACKSIKKLNGTFNTSYTISVNLSILQLLQKDFYDQVVNILDTTKLEPSLLELEITESILIQSYEQVVEKLNQLKALGVKLALDDFGKGYSSLSYLRQLPITTLKIDKTFIDTIERIVDPQNLTESIIHMAKKMGLQIIAEGVETQKQLDYLQNHKCDKIQGYLFSRPIPENQVYDLVKNHIMDIES